MKYTGTMIAGASGSVGGCTYSHNRYGTYIRQRVVPVNPNTPSQALVKGIFNNLSTRWTTVLTQLQRDAWTTWALNTPGFVGTGQNAYIALNSARVRIGQPIIDTAPVIFALAALTPPTIVSATSATSILSIAFDNTDPWANQVGGFLIVSCSRPVQPAIQFFKGPFQTSGQVTGAVVPPGSPRPITSVFPFAVGTRVYARFLAVLADGRISQSLIDTIIAI